MTIRKEVLEQSKKFPSSPGVYIMYGEEKNIIYIGKAKSLKNRIKNYFQGQDKRLQVAFLVNKIFSLDYVITATEEDALLLERELIRKHKPKYNVLLKDDKAYLSVKINVNHAFPKIETARKIINDGSLYFGPFTQGYMLKEILELIKEVVPLRTCANSNFSNRVRPCLEYQIKRCKAPCVNLISKDEYKELLNDAIKILQGKTDDILKTLNDKMEKFSMNMQFENAEAVSQKIELINNFKNGVHLKSHKGERRDFFAFYRDNNLVSLCVESQEGVKLVDNKTFKLENIFQDDEDLLEEILIEYYENTPDLPSEIVTNINLENYDKIKNHLKKLYGIAIPISCPKIGDKMHALNLAVINAKKSFTNFFEKDEVYRNIAKELKKKFNLKKYPRYVECVDISNLQSSDIVGGIVSFYDGEPRRNLYKRYILKNGTQNDFECIFEVVTRRLKRGLEENDIPDLLVIDGGDKQLAKALEARNNLDAKLDIISLAKFRSSHLKPERVFIEGQKEEIELSMNDELSFFMQRIRDEAHHNVITFHRERREKRVMKSSFDDIVGVGTVRKKILLEKFKNVDEILKETPENISEKCGFSIALSKNILSKLNLSKSKKEK